MDELALTCSSDSLCVWQLRSGSILQTFKNNSAATFTSCTGGKVLCPQENKPYIHAYTFNKDGMVWKSPVPEKLISIACSVDGRFCCGGGSSGVIYLWDVYTGDIRCQWQAHFNEVLSISFLGAGSDMIVTAGKDSMIHCWLTFQVMDGAEPKPFRSWSGHALPVTSIHCTNSRILSSSLDHTCKLWCATMEDPLNSITFPSAITCTTMNETESVVYAGSNDGKIYAVDMLVSGTHPKDQMFLGHTKAVTSLSVSFDGTTLLSTSLDGTAKQWDTSSFQLIRNFTSHNGPVTSCSISLLPRCLFDGSTSQTHQIPFPMFKKYGSQESSRKIAVTTTILPNVLPRADTSFTISKGTDVQEELQNLQAKVIGLEDQVSRWNTVGKQLYKMQVGASQV